MTKEDKERIDRLENYLDSIPKEELDKIIDEVDKLGIEGPTVEEYFNPYKTGFEKGKIEGFNEGIEAAKQLVWQYRFDASFVTGITDELENLKK